MTITAPTLAEAKPTCADPKWLEVIDAAFKRPGGPGGQIMAAVVCPGCPVRVACLDFAMANGEHGPWGGLTSNQRTRLRGHTTPATFNIRGVHRAMFGDDE